MDSWLWYLLTSGWLVALVMLPVLARRHTPAKAWAWLAVMLAGSWAGLLLYLLFGENPLGRRRTVRYRRAVEGSKAAEVLARLEHSPRSVGVGQPWRAIETLAEGCGALPSVAGNEGEILSDHEETVRRVIEDINTAEHHVHMVFYIFGDDRTGRRIARALARAAERGVQCRVVADTVGSHRMFDTIGAWMRKRGVEVHQALPFKPFRRRLARLDVRNHRKIIVVDGQVGYVGSWNVVDPTYKSRVIGGEYRDLLLRVRGPVVLHLQLLFLEDWILETGEKLDRPDVLVQPGPAGDSVMQVVPSAPLYPYSPVRDLAIGLVHHGRQRVTVTSPYFVPDDAFLLALRLAAQRGVQVDVIVPRKSDSHIADAAARAYLRLLAAAGVNVYCHRRHFLHAKMLTVDGTVAMMGSANFDMRSFHLNIESNILIYSERIARQLCELQDRHIADSMPLSERLARRSRLGRIADDCAKLVSPLA